MVEYRKWVSIMFDAHGSSEDATLIMKVAAREWRENKQDLLDATVAEARRYAKTL